MAKQTIDIGTAANDGTGDDLRTGATKINENFTEVYGDIAALQVATGSTITGLGFDSGKITFEGATDDTNETTFQVIDPTKDNQISLPDSSGTVALVDDIQRIVDSNYVALITGAAFSASSTLTLIDANALDSGRATSLIDSAYIRFRADSSYITDIIDSAYVQLRQVTVKDSAFVTSIVDSSYIQTRLDSAGLPFLDSSEALAMFDSAYLKFRIDSDYVKDIVDSNHVKLHAKEVDLRSYTVSTVPTGTIGKLIFTTDGASGTPCLAIFDGTSYKRIVLGSTISP
tara:strand:- start:114 stop:971 length:858 start_codon:yes stop_codon:yes gene_type:complete